MNACMLSAYNPHDIPPEELAARFVGRERVFERLLAILREQEGRKILEHCLLLGPRGAGKTTLLLMLHREIQRDPALFARWLPVRFKEEQPSVHSLADLFLLTLENLHEGEGFAEAGRLKEAVVKEGTESRRLAAATDALRKVSRTTGKRLLLLLENVDLIWTGVGRDQASARALRRILSTEGFLLVIGTSVKVFEEIAGYDQAFFNYFHPHHLAPLPEPDVERMIRRLAEQDGNEKFLREYGTKRAHVRAITELTGGNPRLVCMLYRILSAGGLPTVAEELRALVDGITPLYKDVVDHLPRQQAKVLDGLMRNGGRGSPSEIARIARLQLNAVTTQLGRLKEGGFVEAGEEGKGARYLVADALFRTWYQMRYFWQRRRRFELLVDFLKAWFSSEDLRKAVEQTAGTLSRSGGAGGRAQKTVVSLEYYAAASGDPSVRQTAFERIADFHLGAGSREEAALAMAEARGLDPSRPDFEIAGYRALGKRLLEKGEPSQAIATLEEALKRSPDHPETMVDLGVARGMSGDHAGALELFEGLCASTDQPPAVKMHALENRAVAHDKLGNVEEAVQCWSKVAETDGASQDQVGKALFNKGVALGELGRPEEEFGVYDDMVRRFKDRPETPLAELVVMALLKRGILMGNRGEYTKAREDLDAALKLPAFPAFLRRGLLLLRGTSHLMQGNLGLAEVDLRAAIGEGLNSMSMPSAYAGLLSCVKGLDRESEIPSLLDAFQSEEPIEGGSFDDALAMRVSLMTQLTRSAGPAWVGRHLARLAESKNPAFTARLVFLKPVFAALRTGDRAPLDLLPIEEKNAAEMILEGLKKSNPGEGGTE
ncbi:MAG: tetratricopeptide repeat protein [Planctomycetes bacterium]|nr:tetratricopeptide repeat protein [Planctomycetota bacterium]